VTGGTKARIVSNTTEVVMLKQAGVAGIVLATLLSGRALAQSPGTLGWAVKAGGPGADYVYDAIVLGDGSVVITGEYWDEITFGGSTFDAAGTDELNEECDMFVAKYSSQGVLLWANHAGGKYSDRGLRVREVGSNIEVTGTGFGFLTFSAAPPLLAEEEYYFVANYDTATGAFVSASLPPTPGGRTDTPLLQPSVNLGVPNWLAGLADGSTIRTGKIWLAEKVGASTLTSHGGEDALIVRQDSTGAVLWAKNAGGAGKDWGNAVAARPDGVGGVVVVGNFDQNATFGEGEPGETTLFVSGADSESEIFIAKYRLAAESTSTFESQGAQDGYVRELNEGSGTGSGVFAAAADPYAVSIGDDNLKRQYVAVLSFDTSTIPDGATISSVTLRLVRSTQVGDNPFVSLPPLVVDVKTGALNGNTALEAADFQAAVDASGVATMSEPLVNGATSSGSFNLAGRNAINKTGVTQLKVRFTLDDDNDAVIDGMGFYSGENATPANRPKLDVTYY